MLFATLKKPHKYCYLTHKFIYDIADSTHNSSANPVSITITQLQQSQHFLDILIYLPLGVLSAATLH